MTDEAVRPPAVIKTNLPRETIVSLAWPIDFDGQTYDKIRVRRLTGLEVQTFIEGLESGNRSSRPPMVDCPDEVFAALDDDDRLALEVAAIDFLPRRFRELAGVSTPGNSGASSPLSPAS